MEQLLNLMENLPNMALDLDVQSILNDIRIKDRIRRVARSGDLEGLTVLLQQHQDKKLHALQEAVGGDQLHVTQYLVTQGVNVHNMKPWNNPLRAALDAKALRCAAWFVSIGVTLPSIPKKLQGLLPPLVYAARRGDDAAVEALLNDGYCGLDDKGAGGMTALAWAVRRGKWGCALLLVKAGARTRTWTGTAVHDVAKEALNKKSCPNPLKQVLVEAQVKEEIIRLFDYADSGQCVERPHKKAKGDDDETLLESWAELLYKIMGEDGHCLPGAWASIVQFL